MSPVPRHYRTAGFPDDQLKRARQPEQRLNSNWKIIPSLAIIGASEPDFEYRKAAEHA